MPGLFERCRFAATIFVPPVSCAIGFVELDLSVRLQELLRKCSLFHLLHQSDYEEDVLSSARHVVIPAYSKVNLRQGGIGDTVNVEFSWLCEQTVKRARAAWFLPVWLWYRKLS